MSKLNINSFKKKLVREEEVKKATFQTLKLDMKKPGEVKAPGISASEKFKKLDQIASPSKDKLKDVKRKPGIEQAPKPEMQGPKPVWSKEKNQKGPNPAKFEKGDKPNQDTKLKEITKKIQNTEEGKTYKSALPQAKMAGEYIGKMPTGSKTVNSDGASGGGEPKKPTWEKGNATTTGKSKEMKGSATRETKKVEQVKGPSKDLSMPSDAPSKPKVETLKTKSTNVRESVVVKLGGKVKAKFDIVSEEVLNKLVESYAQHNYKLTVEKGEKAAWKSDKAFLQLVSEAVSAKFNGVPAEFNRLVKEARNRYHKLSLSSYNDLYESRDAFVDTINSGFKRILEAAERKYVSELNTFDCLVRVAGKEGLMDVEIVAEARDSAMAARLVRNRVVEEFGFGVQIKHVFVDGQKFKPEQITEWAASFKKKI